MLGSQRSGPALRASDPLQDPEPTAALEFGPGLYLVDVRDADNVRHVQVAGLDRPEAEPLAPGVEGRLEAALAIMRGLRRAEVDGRPGPVCTRSCASCGFCGETIREFQAARDRMVLIRKPLR